MIMAGEDIKKAEGSPSALDIGVVITYFFFLAAEKPGPVLVASTGLPAS